MKKPMIRLAALAAVATLSVAVVVSASSRPTKAGAIKSGGTLTLGWEQSFGFTDNMDPTGEYLGDAWGILTNLLTRSLVGYKHTAGAEGNTPVADIATSLPKPTNGGKTYTFHIKPGIKFGPPVNRAVTSKDIVTAMERLASKTNGAQYAFYYTDIAGWTAYADGKAKSISGIKTPNASTISFTLAAPAGDFLQRMSMPATAPMPAEVVKCFDGFPGVYSANLISTAGYMLKGIDKVDISSCSKLVSSKGKVLQSIEGFQATSLIDLVRNPNYSQKTDPTRKNYVDEVKFVINASAVDIHNKIEAGQYNLAGSSSVPPDVIKKYATTGSLKGQFHQNQGDRTWYLTMNTTQPPFDDVHVRRAMNWIIDKAGLRQAWGGPTAGSIANHVVPDTLFGSLLTKYRPYATAGDHGDVKKAMAAMKGSKYSTGNSGMCDADACHDILMISDTRGVDPGMVATIEQDAKKIGITFKVQSINGAYPTIQEVAKNIPIAERPGWGKDYADAVTFFSPLFDGRTIIAKGNTNYSLLGITPAQCKELKVTGNCTNVPSVNTQLDKCKGTTGAGRLQCYANLDKYLMEQVVPWVPWMWSLVTRITATNVSHYQFDQFAATPAWSQIAVK